MSTLDTFHMDKLMSTVAPSVRAPNVRTRRRQAPRRRRSPAAIVDVVIDVVAVAAERVVVVKVEVVLIIVIDSRCGSRGDRGHRLHDRGRTHLWSGHDRGRTHLRTQGALPTGVEK